MELVKIDSFELSKKEEVINKYRDAKEESRQLKLAIEKMAMRKKLIDQEIEFFEKKTHEILSENGIKKINCGEFDLTVKKATTRVEIVDEKLIPKNFIEIKEVIQTKVDKKKIKDFIKDTGEIPKGVEVVSGKKSITITKVKK